MRKPHLPIVAVAIGAILAMAPLHALAQQVTFIPVGGVSVPTLNTYGLILMLLVVAGAAYWLTRKRGTASRLLTLVMVAAGGAFLASNHDLIGSAWATYTPTYVTATQSPVNLTGAENYKVYEISNGTSTAIIITALVNGGSCGTNGTSFFLVNPYLNAGPVPGCTPSLQVAPGNSCAVQTYCDADV